MRVNQGWRNPRGDGEQVKTLRTGRKGNGWERERNLQGDWGMIADVHVLGYSEPILSLNMTKYEQGGTATAVKA